MNVLFIGGTGIISSACTALALKNGINVTLLNRGRSARPAPKGIESVRADIGDPSSVSTALAGRSFDVVVDWVAYTPDHIERDIDLFRDRTSQYVFISSASAYQTPPDSLPITEETPLSNPFWGYSRQKIACEERLKQAFEATGFPVTVVRPSHTYDERSIPIPGGYTAVDRMRRGKPVIVHGDGTSLWVLTHHRDFAVGLVGLLGNSDAVGEAFHITSDELLSWNQIFGHVARAAGVEPRLVHIPSGRIAESDSEWGASLLGDKAHSMIFDNSKIRRFVPGFAPRIPFERGAEEIMAWFDADPARQVIDVPKDRLMDQLIAKNA